MHFPKHWARATHTHTDLNGKRYSFTCWGWSDESLADAQRLAEDRAARLAAKLSRGEPLNRYGYSDRPLREEQLEVYDDEAGKTLAVITRNSYGALVLNAARAMFIDIDLPEAKSAGGGFLGKLFGGKQSSPEEDALERIKRWAARRPDNGVRVYRTAAGLRGLVTSYPFHPADGEAQAILRELGSDPLYITLCRAQESFRARLTPKPWRCGMPNPPSPFPHETSQAQHGHAQWLVKYETAATQYATCRLVGHYGDTRPHPEIEPIVAVHDKHALAAHKLPLA